MPKSVTVILAGDPYEVPHLNIGQLQEITESDGKSFAVLRIAMRRAKPKIVDLDAIEAEPDEVAAAVKGILIASGLKGPNPKNGEGPAKEPASTGLSGETSSDE